MTGCNTHRGINRRGFFSRAAAVALATQVDVLDFASSLLAAEAAPAAGPRVGVVFFRRLKGGGCTWPAGTAGDLKDMQKLFTRTLTDAAERFGVRLDVQDEPVEDVPACLERLKKTAPDGLIVVAMELHRWKQAFQLLAKRGAIPTAVYANISGFSPQYRQASKYPSVLLGSTPRVDWLAHAVRMFKTHWRLKHLKLLHCPDAKYYEAFKKVGESDELRAVADYYAKNAKQIVEPKKADILAAAKHYILLRRLIQAGGYDGITVSGSLCISAGGAKANPACVAVSRLLDDGIVAACERDVDAARCQLLTLSLFDRPGFMGNPSPNTVDNTFIVTHCTSALRLEGVNRPYRAPFVLRNFHAMGGVCPMVAWPVGKAATVMDFLGGKSVLVNSARVVANTEKITQPPCGGCRTSVELAVDGVANTLDIHAGHHKWCILGNYARKIRNFCKLTALPVADLTGKPYPS